jgi:hypothetical protein
MIMAGARGETTGVSQAARSVGRQGAAEAGGARRSGLNETGLTFR